MGVSCVNVNTGNYHIFDETYDDFVGAVVGSAAMPFIFPHENLEVDGTSVVCMDGGTAWNVNLKSAVDRCLEAVGDESLIDLDVIMAGDHELAPYKNTTNTWGNHLRF